MMHGTISLKFVYLRDKAHKYCCGYIGYHWSSIAIVTRTRPEVLRSADVSYLVISNFILSFPETF